MKTDGIYIKLDKNAANVAIDQLFTEEWKKNALKNYLNSIGELEWKIDDNGSNSLDYTNQSEFYKYKLSGTPSISFSTNGVTDITLTNTVVSEKPWYGLKVRVGPGTTGHRVEQQSPIVNIESVFDNSDNLFKSEYSYEWAERPDIIHKMHIFTLEVSRNEYTFRKEFQLNDTLGWWFWTFDTINSYTETQHNWE